MISKFKKETYAEVLVASLLAEAECNPIVARVPPNNISGSISSTEAVFIEDIPALLDHPEDPALEDEVWL